MCIFVHMKTIILYLNFETGQYRVYKTLKVFCDKHPEFKYKTLQRQISKTGKYNIGGLLVKRVEIIKE